MAIDISHRLRNHNNSNRRVFIPQKTPKKIKGFSFNCLSVAALVFAAIGFAGYVFSGKLGTIPYTAVKFLGQAVFPLSAFLTAQVYNYAENPRKTVPVLGVLTLITHVPYVFMVTGGFGFIIHTSLMFPLFMGCAGLMLSDMPNIDRNVKTILMLLICFAAPVGDGGSLVTVWVIIFGTRYDKQTQMKLFYAAGFVMTAINLIYGIIGGQWYSFIPQLGFLLAVPFINGYNPFKTDISKSLIYAVLYPVIILIFAVLKFIF
ncbi:MAG: hypothetical protein IJA12_00315 [Oscillospiraceae bacterium]|nr:hypothetical protein [Oscillospiraceae bacterium]